MSLPPSALKKIGVNAMGVLGGDVLNKAGTFLVYAILARSASVHEFGQLSLGLLLLYTFHVFAVAGLPVSLTREVAKRPRGARRLLQHGYLAASASAVLAMLTMIALAIVMQYERQTVIVIALLALAVPPYALTMITEAVIKGREQMHLITVGNVPGNVFLVVSSFVAIMAGYGVPTIAGMIVASRCITFLTMHQLFLWGTQNGRAGRLHPRLAGLLLRRSMVFFGTDGMHAVGASLSGLLLSKFASERELGLLGASYQLMQPIQMFYRSVGHSCFPQLVAAARTSQTAVGNLARSLVGFILRLAVPATIGVFCLAGDLLVMVYGNPEFRAGAAVFQMVAFTLLLDPLNPILGHGLWAMGHDKTVLRIVFVNVVSHAVAGFLLIGQFGLMGAAYTSLVISGVNLLQHYWGFQRGVARLHLGRELLRIAPPTLLAIACIALLPLHRYAALTIALSLYMLIAFFRIDHLHLRSPATSDSGK